MLEKIKVILNIEKGNEEFDEILNLMLEDAITAILSYCNIKKLPVQLEYIAREIVVNFFKNETQDTNISSIKRGDTQISYTNFIDINTFTKKQLLTLNRFRRITVR